MRPGAALAGSIRPSSGWIPVGLLVLAAFLGPIRIPILGVIAAVGIGVLVRADGRTPTGPGVAWLAALPIAVSLAVGLLPDPAIRDPAGCDDLLAGPVPRRLAQAGAALLVVALLAPRLGGRRSLGLVMPPDRRVTLLALASPILVPLGIVIGPIIAVPFFGQVPLGLPTPWALVPAVVVAVTNSALEEVIYRGALQRWAAPVLGVGGAILAQALVFGSAHNGADVLAGGPLIGLGMVAAGLVAGLVADRTRSLLLVFAVHAAIDVPLALALTCRVA